MWSSSYIEAANGPAHMKISLDIRPSLCGLLKKRQPELRTPETQRTSRPRLNLSELQGLARFDFEVFLPHQAVPSPRDQSRECDLAFRVWLQIPVIQTI